MSTPTQKKPISVVIFDRSQAGLSDVPIFSQKLKEKVNTPVEQKIGGVDLSPRASTILEHIQTAEKVPTSSTPTLAPQRSVLRADSSGGQTGEFAQSTEAQSTQNPIPSVQSQKIEKQVSNTTEPYSQNTENSLVDDPMLIRLRHDATALLSLVNPKGVEWVVTTRITVKRMEKTLIADAHKHGLLDVAVVPEMKQSFFLEHEELLYRGKRAIATVKDTVQMLPDLLKKFATYAAVIASVRQREVRTFVRMATHDVHLPTVSLPSFHFPKIAVPTISRPNVKVPEIARPVIVIPTIVLPEFNFVRFTSRVLLAGSLVLMLMTVGPMVVLEAQSWKQKISYAITNIPSHAQDTSAQIAVKPTPEPTRNPAPDKQFQIIIPKIGVNSKVIANVDPGSEKDYTAALKKGVAHAAGTGLPGEPNTENKTIFIFGHSTNGEWNIARYNALFYALKDMVVGDEFSVWFWGKEYHYTVKETKIVESSDVSFLVPQTSKDQLILQTCWPPGTSWKRFLVIAEPKN